VLGACSDESHAKNDKDGFFMRAGSQARIIILARVEERPFRAAFPDIP
jgi:hypothetical protein